MTYSKSENTINTILEAARILFVKRNYADVTITDLAARANVSAGALYHHFSSKEDIYLRMMHQILEQIKDVLQAAIDQDNSGSSREGLRHSVLAFLHLPQEFLGVLRLVRRDINIFSDPERTELIHTYQKAIPDQVEAILAEGIMNGEIQPVDARLLAWQMIALVEVSLHPDSRKVLGDQEKMADYVVGLFLDGIAVHETAVLIA